MIESDKIYVFVEHIWKIIATFAYKLKFVEQ